MRASTASYSGFVSGDSSQLFELPGGPISFALGAEYRKEDARYNDDDFAQTGLTNGVQYYFWIKARQSSDNVWINSNAAGVIPIAGSGGNTYHWPLTGNLGTHDPTLINENGTWWEFQTGAGIYGKVSRNGGLQWDPLPSVLPTLAAISA